MKKIVFLTIYFALSSITPAIWGYEDSTDLPEIHMGRGSKHHFKWKRHRQRSDPKCSDSHHRGATGPTGPRGATGATGNAGLTGAPGPLDTNPSFGSFYSTSFQVVHPGGAVFFGITGAGPIGTAFDFDPGTDTSGSSFIINETGYYAISYGLFPIPTGELGFLPGVGLNLNSIIDFPGSHYMPADSFGDISMPAFFGIFHLSVTGTLQLINIDILDLLIAPPSFDGGIPVNISAYINIQFLDAD